jgi:hypothetical protein
MVGGTLDEDAPAFLDVLADVVDLDGHPVLGAPYPGARVLIGRAAERDAEHEAPFIQLVADRKHGQAEPARVCEPGDTARRYESPAIGPAQPLYLRIPDPWAGARVTLSARLPGNGKLYVGAPTGRLAMPVRLPSATASAVWRVSCRRSVISGTPSLFPGLCASLTPLAAGTTWPGIARVPV